MRTKLYSIIRRFRKLPRRTRIGVGIIAIIAIAFIGSRVLAGKGSADQTSESVRSVATASVASLAAGGGSISLTGSVTSLHEATLRAQTSGNLTQVYRKLGDNVSAGSVMAEFDNGAERAAVLQAQGAYEAALAGSSIADVSRGQSSQTVADVRVSVYNTLHSAYTTMDDAIATKADVVFSNPHTPRPTFNLLVSNSQLQVDLETARPQLEDMLAHEANRNDTLESLNDTALVSEVENTAADLQKTEKYLDTLSLALNQALPTAAYSQSSIDGYKATVSAARSAVAGSLASVSGIRSTYDSALSAATVASHQSGGTQAITTSGASVKQALGALQGAQARLEDTIVRSPISGTIISLPISTGDYVGMGSLAAVVSNNQALEIVTYVNEDDARTIAVGGSAQINGTVAGVITRIAPALDPATNKIEVRVGITGDAQSLTNGSTVRVDLDRSRAQEGSTVIALPIAAIKIAPDEAEVFTVSQDGTLLSHPVTLGEIQGDRVTITAGVTPDMTIVTDARGLKAGEQVSTTTTTAIN